MQFDSRNREPALGILFHVAYRVVGVIIQDKLLLTGDREKGEHVTTGERSDESFLRIDVRRIPQRNRGSGRCHLTAAVEAPGVIARILLINKFSAATFPP